MTDPRAFKAGKILEIKTHGKEKNPVQVNEDHSTTRSHQMSANWEAYRRSELPPGVYTLADILKLLFSDVEEYWNPYLLVLHPEVKEAIKRRASWVWCDWPMFRERIYPKTSDQVEVERVVTENYAAEEVNRALHIGTAILKEDKVTAITAVLDQILLGSDMVRQKEVERQGNSDMTKLASQSHMVEAPGIGRLAYQIAKRHKEEAGMLADSAALASVTQAVRANRFF
jgi:hypothetical protein